MNAVRRIRKLLRLARGNGPEAEAAARRAKVLMRQHNVDVSVEENVRLLVQPLDETWMQWREQLLVTCARHHQCRVMSGPDGIVVSGEPEDAKRALDEYRRLFVELSIVCESAWREVFASHEMKPVFQKAFLAGATDMLFSKAPAEIAVPTGPALRKRVEMKADKMEQVKDPREIELHFLARRWGVEVGANLEVNRRPLPALPGVQR